MKPRGKGQHEGGGKRRRASPRQPQPGLGCHDLLARLKSGEISGKSVHRTDRRRLVEYLHFENLLNQVGMARLLQCDEATVRKDMAKIRRANALRADPGFADQIAGEILAMARSAVEHTNRVGRDKSTPPAVRVKAERSGMRMFIEGMKMLQSLGHLPSAALRFKMEPDSHSDGPPDNRSEQPPSLGDLSSELDRLAQIAAKESPGAVLFLNRLRDAVRAGPAPVQPLGTEAAAGFGTHHSAPTTSPAQPTSPVPPTNPAPPDERNP